MEATGFSIFDIFWLIFLMSALQPIFQRKMLENMRARQIAKLERERGSRVVLLVHRQETMSFLGFPLMRYIDINDSEEILRVIHATPKDKPLDIILHTPGGMVIAATQIARAVKAHEGKVTVFVPHFAMSGGTLIALAADEIVMSPHATLGPIDPQLGQMPAASLQVVLQKKEPKDIDDQTIVMADQGAKAIAQVQATAEALLKDKLGAEKAREVSVMLSEGRWTHDYPIFAEHAREIGLPVSTDIPEAVLQMMTLYPQPTQRQPSVEYIPHSQPSQGGRRAH
ncbi:serine protease, ClpP class [Meinhardsimonia xiamenensis]|jgi:ClpP class serine protease|uniref:Serine protease, ClpP class n=1 Tax=Meinhardsimonia xiamenensis TaxID=990712 RepID=A0A1G9D150_9RHOB|nr:ATP-dependent Clp protease proteolytic subunit [Meinhardsimonia xiamenensis]PRX38169.1 ClpP class serine protease [Meinhardsimonia xiamenensis]SDK57599.1 serine protease, ClpP class [Meinhardsimonia xiamenensis]